MAEKSPTQIALDKLREEWTAEERKRFDALLTALQDEVKGMRREVGEEGYALNQVADRLQKILDTYGGGEGA